MPKTAASRSKALAAYLEDASPRFRQVHAALTQSIQALFPDAEPAFAFGMTGWRIPRRRWINPRSVRGTLDPNWVQIYLVERKSGMTLHLWNPADFGVMHRRETELSRVGFKVMVGCIQFNRKADYPIETVDRLLEDVKRSLEDDAKAGRPMAR